MGTQLPVSLDMRQQLQQRWNQKYHYPLQDLWLSKTGVRYRTLYNRAKSSSWWHEKFHRTSAWSSQSRKRHAFSRAYQSRKRLKRL